MVDSRSLDEISGSIVDSALKVHIALGPGLLESVYVTVLARELGRRGLVAKQQVPISFEYDGLHFENCFRIDLLVEDKIIVEVKSVDALAAVHFKQILTYLRLTKMQLGLLINFGGAKLKDGLHRVVNGFTPSAPSRLRLNK